MSKSAALLFFKLVPVTYCYVLFIFFLFVLNGCYIPDLTLCSLPHHQPISYLYVILPLCCNIYIFLLPMCCSPSRPGRDVCSRCLRQKRLWDVMNMHSRMTMHSGQRRRIPVCQTAAVRTVAPVSVTLTHLPLLDIQGTRSAAWPQHKVRPVCQLNHRFKP